MPRTGASRRGAPQKASDLSLRRAPARPCGAYAAEQKYSQKILDVGADVWYNEIVSLKAYFYVSHLFVLLEHVIRIYILFMMFFGGRCRPPYFVMRRRNKMVKLTISEKDVKVMLEDKDLCFFGGYIIDHAKKSKYGYDGKEVEDGNPDTFYYFECSEDLAKVMYNAVIGSYVAGRIYEFTRKLSWKLNKKEVEDNGRGDC